MASWRVYGIAFGVGCLTLGSCAVVASVADAYRQAARKEEELFRRRAIAEEQNVCRQAGHGDRPYWEEGRGGRSFHCADNVGNLHHVIAPRCNTKLGSAFLAEACGESPPDER